MKRNMVGNGHIVAAICGFLGLQLIAGQVFAAGVTLPLVFTGTGAGIESTTSCNGTSVVGTTCDGSSATNCNCFEATGSGKGTVVGSVRFDNKTLVFNPPATGFGPCDYVEGLLTLASPNGKNVLALYYIGQECLGPNSYVLNGTWSTDNADSKGKFATANGGGILIGNEGSSGNVFGNLNGTLQLP